MNASLPVNYRLNAVRILMQVAPEQATSAFRILLKDANAPFPVLKAAYDYLFEVGRVDGIESPITDERSQIILSETDKVPMVIIPAGPFFYGIKGNPP